MTHLKFFFIIVVFWSLTPLLSIGNEYYVSNSGSDNALGTIEAPFKTLQYASSIMQPGDICYLREGIYRETLIPLNSGTENQPIIYTAYNQENVMITGLDLFEDWSPESNGVWKCAGQEEISQLFVNKVHCIRARYPNIKGTEYDSDNWANIELFANKSGTMEGISSLGTLKGAKIVGLGKREWVTVMGEISTNSGSGFNVINTSHQWSNYSPEIYLGNGKGFLIDHKKLLDEALEWFSDETSLYFIPPENKDPNELSIEGRTRILGADLRNKQFIRLEGLHFKAASLCLRNSKNCEVNLCTFRYVTPFFKFKNGFNRDSSYPDNWEGNGLEVSGSNNVIKNCYIAHSWGDGVTMWGENNILENCIVEDCNWLAVDSAPLCVTGSGHRITQNTLKKTARSVLVHRHLQAAEITNNDMGFCGLICDDLGLTYSFQSDGAGTEIAYNWVHDNLASHTGPGIYLDNGDANYLIHHNVVWNCEAGIRLNLPQTNTQVYNNTFWNNRSPMGEWGPDGTSMSNCHVWNNIQNHEKFIGNTQENNLYIEEDQFMEAENGDFRLKEDAQAIDYGRIIDGITEGFTGAAPDAGAYELGTNWQAGANIKIPDFEDSKPNAPSDLTLEVTNSGIYIKWIDRSNNESGFAIDRKLPNGSIEEIIRVDPDSNHATDSLIKTYTTYLYRIRAYNSYGSNANLQWCKITTPGDGTMVFLEAEEYDEQAGINNFGEQIGSCDNGDYILFRNVNFGFNLNSFTMRCAVPSEYASQKINLVLDDYNSAVHSSITVSATGGWNEFEEQTIKIDEISGIHDLYFVFAGGYGVGNFDWFKFTIDTTTVSSSNILKQPELHLEQNFPNPFNNNTTIRFELPNKNQVNLSILDMNGRQVRNIFDRNFEKGTHKVVINLNGMAPGYYFFQIMSKEFVVRRKMLLTN